MPNLNLNIDFDLDGVLVNYLDYLKSFLLTRGIKHIPTKQWYFDTVPEIKPEKLNEYINEAMRGVDHIHPIPGARHVLKYLFELTGDPITIITARPHSNIDVTQESIERVAGGIPYLFSLVDSGKEKFKYVRKKCYIDDRRSNCIELAKRGYTVFMPETEYNWPIKPEAGFSITYKGLLQHAGVWHRTDGQIIVIDEIRCLLKAQNLKLIVS